MKKKNLKTLAACLCLSCTLLTGTLPTQAAARTSVSQTVQAAALTEGSWEQTSSGWKFLNRDRQPYTGWIHTASGWYYLNMEDGSLVTGWKNINIC